MKATTLLCMRIVCLLLCPIFCSLPETAAAATQFDLYPTYRQDNFVWNKGDVNNVPNVLSELKWTQLRTNALKGVLKQDLGPKYFLEASGSWGYTFSGLNQDSDYSGSNRTDEFSRSNNNGSGGTMFDASLALGWKLQNSKKAKTSLLAGYAVNRQTLNMFDYVQTIDTNANPRLGPDPSVSFIYMALWRGPWIGISHESELNKRLQLTTRLEYHIPNYNGECHWASRDDLAHPVSNNHWSRGEGIVASLGFDYAAGPKWKLGAGIDYTHYWIQPGTDQVNSFDDLHAQLPLNEVRWDSWAFRLKATYRF